ncbi:hypothetical protein BU24DRAFT_487174 [Aaosphaeria arxii CBS 175.79]|uniref:Ubiquitin-like protease family profile domain-containing protein n=1 Tax=Aaosphaeria arxii CBS 175.79 TaxID=1450172 RepID=A0A6A5Y5P1_9PLEO|nr:uncharacterized protein BU24DRAFT_487174 [Aaosphaeria arxii CBS 175.79]KAF2020589.1 hypothetical protein BU24DRAFT_487174 [Aaosphaeria arxii CBS 175.79]
MEPLQKLVAYKLDKIQRQSMTDHDIARPKLAQVPSNSHPIYDLRTDSVHEIEDPIDTLEGNEPRHTANGFLLASSVPATGTKAPQTPGRRYTIDYFLKPSPNTCEAINHYPTPTAPPIIPPITSACLQPITPSPNPPPTLILETANSSITPSDYTTMTSTGYAGWLTQDALSLSLDLLSQFLSCPTHSILLANAEYARHCHTIGQPSHPASDIKGYEHVLAALTPATHIFLPISDGFFATTSDSADPVGTHWTLLYITRSTEGTHTTLKALSFDSLTGPNPSTDNQNHEASLAVVAGVKKLLSYSPPTQTRRRRRGEPRPPRPKVTTSLKQVPSPSQSRHNAAARKDGRSACGPFVWGMTAFLARAIVEHAEGEKGGEVLDVEAFLDGEFPGRWGAFWDSIETRGRIRGMVLREMRERVERCGSWEWGEYSRFLEGEGVRVGG